MNILSDDRIKEVNKNIPTYEYLEDLVIIGTSHLVKTRKSKLKKFSDELQNCEHLLMEGTRLDASRMSIPNFIQRKK